MDWNKAKTILIMFFLVINLALIFYITVDNRQAKKSEESVYSTVISLLDEKDIHIDKSLILKSNKGALKNIYVKNVISDYESFAKKILGDYLVPLNENEYENDTGIIFFSGDCFSVKSKEGKYIKQAELNKDNITDIITEYLTDIGFEAANAKIISSVSELGFTVYYYPIIDSSEVFKTQLTISATDKGILQISGNWYNLHNKNTAAQNLKPIAGALIEYMNNHSSDGKINISDISLGYMSPDTGSYHEKVLLTPVWRITGDNGETAYVDARENI